MNKMHIPYLVLGVVVAAAAFFGLSSVCDSLRTGQVFVQKTAAMQDGYMLIAPYRVDIKKGAKPQKGMVQLVNRNGIALHTWRTEAPVLVAHLQKNGTLFVSMTPSIDHTDYPGFGTTGIIQQLDWDGKVLWEHRDPQMTIDFEVMSDGSVAYLRWEEASPSFAAQVRGGFKTATTSVWANDLVVVNRDHATTSVWHLSEKMKPYAYTINPSAPRQEFAHANSIRYVPDNPITHAPAFVVSVRHISKVLLIDVETGDIAWESPDGLFSMQHDATLLLDGHLLAFDNGFARDHITALLSRAVEVDMETGLPVWTYDGGKTMTGKAQFASSIMGGAERLSNGNTFITLSTQGRVLEVTEDGDIVWEYRYGTYAPDGELPILFRARLYEKGEAAWMPKIAWPRFFSSLFCKAGV